jgi:Sigma-70 region 2.
MESVLYTYQEKFRKEDEKLFIAVHKLKKGDREAFENVYKLSEKYIYSVIYRIIQDNDKTADLMQETYLQIYNKIGTLDNEERFLVWAGRIATNMTLRYIQKTAGKYCLRKKMRILFLKKQAMTRKNSYLKISY